MSLKLVYSAVEFNEKSEAIATCKEMLVIPINKVVDKNKEFSEKGGPRRRRGTRGH
jgi:hypothetical protein